MTQGQQLLSVFSVFSVFSVVTKARKPFHHGDTENTENPVGRELRTLPIADPSASWSTSRTLHKNKGITGMPCLFEIGYQLIGPALPQSIACFISPTNLSVLAILKSTTLMASSGNPDSSVNVYPVKISPLSSAPQ